MAPLNQIGALGPNWQSLGIVLPTTIFSTLLIITQAPLRSADGPMWVLATDGLAIDSSMVTFLCYFARDSTNVR